MNRQDVLTPESLPTSFLDDLRELEAAYCRHDDPIRQSGLSGGSQRWREERKPILDAVDSDGDFLDVGCATGFFLNGIKMHSAWEVYGTDFGEDAVRVAREGLGLDVRLGELSDIGFDDAFFDYIHVNNVLEHVRDPVVLLRECRRIIKPDGKLFLSVPNGRNDSLDLIAF